jgi:D-beta-D-heptose 7-phosphate kinase / D-beta-D-heptose 1-phosphate adenosyltransferase
VNLLVLGDTLLDSDLDGTTERLCPDAPVPVVDVVAERLRPGGAGLAALLAASLWTSAGRRVTLVTALGTDHAARQLTALLGAAGVEVVRLPLHGATVRKTRLRLHGRPLLRLDSGDGRATHGAVDASVLDAVRGADAVLVSDYGRGVAAEPALRGALAELVARVPVVWDPHPNGPPPVPGCRLVTPNQREALQFAQACTAETAATTLRHRWACTAVAVTLGASGALVRTAERTQLVPVPPHGRPGTSRAVDVCGAGDRFAVAATTALLDGTTVEHAVASAVRAASQFVAAGGAGSIGARSPVVAGFQHVVRPEVPVPSAGHEPAALAFAARLRREGGRLIATGGCFDLLHPGHVNLLRQARALGDGLVVCVNSDDSVRRLKGPDRPVMPLAARVELLAALDPVDAVVTFDEDTPSALLERLRPDVWVKGGDYSDRTANGLPEAGAVYRHGGEVVLIPIVDGYSTSRLVRQLATEGSR